MDTRVVAHRLTKEHGSAPELFLRDQLNPSGSDAVQTLVAGARKSLRRSGAMGKFARDTADRPHEFEALLTAYLANPGEEQFLAFSRSAMQNLLRRISGKVAATGGNVVFIHYEQDSGPAAGEQYMVIALITEQGATAFDDQMNVIESVVVDLEHLKHGARVKVEAVETNQDGVLTLLSGRKVSQVAEYFSEFLGSAEFTDSAAASQQLKHRLTDWAEEEGLSRDERDVLLSAVYRYWQDHDGKTQGIELQGLANYLYPEDPDTFLNFMTAETGGVPGQTPPIKPANMRHFQKFVFNRQGLRLEFERSGPNNWSTRIQADDDGNVIIHEAPQELVDRIRGDDEP